MADYVFEITAQAWRTDSYYVGSSQPVHHIKVVASTEGEAQIEATRVLGELDRSWYWRFWVESAKDVRLVKDKTGSTA